MKIKNEIKWIKLYIKLIKTSILKKIPIQNFPNGLDKYFL